MDFSERFSQVLQRAWGYNTDGNLDREGSLVFYSGGSVSEETSVCFEGGVYSFYVYERGERGNPLIQSSRLNVMEHCLTLKYANSFRIKRGFPPLQLYRTIRMHVEWSLVPVDSKPWHGFFGIRRNTGVFVPCRTTDGDLLSSLSFVVEYSPLDVLECYLRPDAGPLLSQWVDLEWRPEEDE